MEIMQYAMHATNLTWNDMTCQHDLAIWPKQYDITKHVVYPKHEMIYSK